LLALLLAATRMIMWPCAPVANFPKLSVQPVGNLGEVLKQFVLFVSAIISLRCKFISKITKDLYLTPLALHRKPPPVAAYEEFFYQGFAFPA